MNWQEFDEAAKEARRTLRQADQVARNLACFLRGRLRLAEVDTFTLETMKRELRDFNLTTQEWKEKP